MDRPKLLYATPFSIVATVALLGLFCLVGIGGLALLPNAADIGLAVPSEHTTWPWPDAVRDQPHRGVTHWMATSHDGTICDLLEFDFTTNPNLRFEIYAQDEDDAKPFDNVVKFWRMGVGQAVRHLNQRFAIQKSGQVIAAWNGPFFGYYHSSSDVREETAFHLAPVVLRGHVYHNTGNHRWTFGVKQVANRPVFKVFHLPGGPVLEREFDFASGTVQCLLKDGKPLRMEPFPHNSLDFKKQPVPSTPQEAGHIPYFDHAKFSRCSIGWSKDNSKLYTLVIREPQGASEGQSITDLTLWRGQSQGWNVPDVQRFWISMKRAGKVWNAINSDAGDVAQLAYEMPDGNYLMVSPIGDNPNFARRVFTPQFDQAPQGGSLMYFYVRDAKETPK